MGQTSNNRTDRKKEKTLNQIITIAVDLFNQYGLEAVSMEQIAGSADIAKGTLYNYFSSKEAIINAYLQRSFQVQNDDRISKLQLLPDTRSRLSFIFAMLIEGVQRQKDIFMVFMLYRMKNAISFQPVDDEEQTGLSLLIHEIIILGQKNHEIRTDLPMNILEGLFEYALISAIKPLYLQPDEFDQELSIQYSVEIFLNGAKA